MTEEKIALRSLLTFLCVAHQGFALLSLFSSLPNENLLSTKLVFLSQSPTIALAWQMDLFSPASSFSPCPFLSRHALPHTELELECHSRLLTDSTTHPYSCSRAVMAESLTNYSCKLFIRDEVKWVIQSCLTLHDFMDCSPWNSPGQNTGMGSLPLCQGIFPTQGSNPGLPQCRWILYQLSYQGSPGMNRSWNKLTSWTTGSKFGWWVKNKSRDINTVERSPFSDKKNPEHICSERSWASLVR